MKPISLHIEIEPDTSLDAPTGGGTPLFLLVPQQAELGAGQESAFMPGAVSLDLRDGAVVLRLDEDDVGTPMEERRWYSARGAKVRVSESVGMEAKTAGPPEETFRGRDWSPAELHITAKDGRVGRPFPLELREGEFVLLGRESPDAQLNIRDEHVSRRHLRILAREGRHYVEDLGSTWGTKLNGAPIAANNSRLLNHRDQILVGNSTITYVNVLEAMREPAGSVIAPVVPPREAAVQTTAAQRKGGFGLMLLGLITLAMMGYVGFLIWHAMR